MATDAGTKKMAAENMSLVIIEAALKAVKVAKKPFKEMTEFEQREFTNNLDHTIKAEITKAVDIIVAEKRTVVKCQVDQVVFKDGVKIVLKAGATTATHDIADAQGQSVLVVVTGVEKYKQEAAPKPEKDQKTLLPGATPAAPKKDGRTSRSKKK